MDADARYERLLNPIRKKIRPTLQEQELILKVREELVGRLQKVVPDDVEIGVMGSTAKGTALAGNRELDIFLLMPRAWNLDDMQKKGLAWSRKAMRGLTTELNYAQHPYLKVYLRGVKADIVPSYKLHNLERLGSAVDRSQLHTLWANPRLNDRLRDDVRLLKQFLKCLGVYGAQTRVEGFSGYLCELLVIHHNGFLPALRAISSWKMPHALDPQKHHAEGEALKLFPNTPLIVIDPVDAHRNVAAVVSRTSMARTILAARSFIGKPSASFFFKEKEVHAPARLRQMIQSRQTRTLLLSFPAPPLVEDVLWPQLKKTATNLVQLLERADFRVFGHYFYSAGGRALILFEMTDAQLPAVKRALGPQVWHEKDVKAFLARHADAANLHVEHERVVAITKREWQTPRALIEHALAKPAKIGIPAPFARALKKRRWGTAMDLLKDASLREVASDYFSRRL